MHKFLSIFFIIALHLFCGEIYAQVKPKKVADSASSKNIADTGTEKKIKKFDPRLATRRSAMLPGWGQIYNKKYWKLPLVWGGLGITTGVFLYNLKTYKLLRQAYIYKLSKDTLDDLLIDPRFSKFSAEAIRENRNLFRQNIDYSVVFFILFWGLQVVDATVDGHLKQFDVNDNLTFQINPGFSQMANTAGISLVLDIHSKKFRAGK